MLKLQASAIRLFLYRVRFLAEVNVKRDNGRTHHALLRTTNAIESLQLAQSCYVMVVSDQIRPGIGTSLFKNYDILITTQSRLWCGMSFFEGHDIEEDRLMLNLMKFIYSFRIQELFLRY